MPSARGKTCAATQRHPRSSMVPTVLAVDPLGAIIFAIGKGQPHRDLFRADDRHAEEARPHRLRRPREHPDQGQEPSARPGGLVEEILKFEAVDLAATAAVGADGEAMERRVGVQW